MHTRRVATFLLGTWIGCTLLVMLITIQNLRFPAALMASPAEPAAQLMKKLGSQESRLLLRYEAAEQNRQYIYRWEEVQLGLAVALGCCLFLGTQRNLLPMILCGLMLALTGFQHFAITPELTYRGREADFPPASEAGEARVRVLLLEQVDLGTEGVKLAIAAVLSGYLFFFRSRGRRKGDAADLPIASQITR